MTDFSDHNQRRLTDDYAHNIDVLTSYIKHMRGGELGDHIEPYYYLMVRWSDGSKELFHIHITDLLERVMDHRSTHVRVYGTDFRMNGDVGSFYVSLSELAPTEQLAREDYILRKVGNGSYA